MNNTAQDTLAYFKPIASYYWHWAEEGRVVEWFNEMTVCYREEIEQLLPHMKGMPMPMGALVAILAAGKPFFDIHAFSHRLHSLQTRLLLPAASKEAFNGAVRDAIFFLESLHELPHSYWEGNNKNWLVHCLSTDFEEPECDVLRKNMADMLRSGQLDDQLFFQPPSPLTITHLQDDIYALATMYREREQLFNLLKQGAPTDPEPLEDIPEVPPTSGSLIDELLIDPKTTGLAKLTKWFMAALQIPPHFQDSSDRPMGGVSDISNRGHFDQLLTSELAHDDDVLLVRLANQEALFLRRENPPQHHQRQRLVLTDTSLRMWGVTRLLGMSAALAGAQHSKVKSSWALAGERYESTDLTTVAGIRDALLILSPALHSAPALTAFANEQAISEEDEYFLVTSDYLFHTPAYQQAFTSIRSTNGFVVTVNNNGDVQLFHYQGGHRRLLRQLKVDVDELLRNEPVKHIDYGMPAFLQQDTYPLWLPTLHVKPNRETMFKSSLGVLGFSDEHRLLYWKRSDTGAIELMPYVAFSSAWFGASERHFHILTYNQRDDLFTIYSVNLDMKSVRYNKMRLGIQQNLRVLYSDRKFFIRTNSEMLALNMDNFTVTSIPPEKAFNIPVQNVFGKREYNELRNFIYPRNYKTIDIARKLGLRQGSLVAQNNVLQEINGELHWIKLDDPEKDIQWFHAGNRITQSYKALKYYLFTTGQLEGIVDNKGLIHLRHKTEKLPEVTIVAVMGMPTAAWASDGKVCGAAYFTGDNTNKISVQDFYAHYIKPLIS
jgi:hypothetical protein